MVEEVKYLLSVKIRKIPLSDFWLEVKNKNRSRRTEWSSPYAITDFFEDLDVAFMDTRMGLSCPFWIVVIAYFSHNSLFSINYLI